MPNLSQGAAPTKRRETLVLVITGPVGAGKSTTADALSDLLGRQNTPHAVVDMDYLRSAWPSPSDDRFNVRLGLRNLVHVAATYRERGCRVLVLADVVEQESDRANYERAIPDADVRIVRLRVPLPLVSMRLQGRESGEHLAWSLNRAPELEGIMDAAGIGTGPSDLVVDVGERSPEEVAREIAERLTLLR